MSDLSNQTLLIQTQTQKYLRLLGSIKNKQTNKEQQQQQTPKQHAMFKAFTSE